MARRLIAAADRVDAQSAAGAAGDRRRRIAAVAALVVVPAVALGGYAALGRPEMRDLPLASRQNEMPDKEDVADLVGRVEQELAKHPEDGRGWDVVAPIYMRLERPSDAATAYANAIRLLGSTPDRQADYGEALFAAADGVVTSEARAAFEKSVEGDVPSLKGSVYLARAAEQDGDLAGSLARLKALLEKSPPDAGYLPALKREFERLADVPALPAPAGADAAEQKTPEQRMAMVRSMVDGLGERLKGQGGDVGEWLRLVKARVALGDVDKAKAALAAAREKFSADGRAAARLEALALGLGLEGRGA